MTKPIFVAKKRADLVAKKRADLTEDEFITYWLQVHAPLVAKIPGIG
jgi:hypothetical protein